MLSKIGRRIKIRLLADRRMAYLNIHLNKYINNNKLYFKIQFLPLYQGIPYGIYLVGTFTRLKSR